MQDVYAAALQRARAAGVRGLLLAGVDAQSWRLESALCAQHVELAIAYGLHPCSVAQMDDATVQAELAALAKALRGEPMLLLRPHALGELGLHSGDAQTRASLLRQEQAFRAQLALACQFDLPLVLHIVKAHKEALRILRTEPLPTAGGVVHSYSGSAELVPEYLQLGLHISFSGAVTYPHARRLHAAARAVPLHRLLVETDAPDQTPWLRRPAQNEPAFLADVLAALADLRQEPVDLLARATADNARRLFRIRT